MKVGHDSLNTLSQLEVSGNQYHYYSLEKAAKAFPGVKRLPYSLKILLENLLRFEDGETVTLKDIETLANWTNHQIFDEIAYRPTRVLMQDFTGVPAIVDLAAMRDALTAASVDSHKISPLTPVHLVIDHSIMVDKFATSKALELNTQLEMQRNKERYEFLRWGQQTFDNFQVVPPGTGICHQVNLEYLGKTIWKNQINGLMYAYPDTLVGTDSHTTMINALGILGWGVGGIEAEAAMLGQPISMLIPEVIGFKLSGNLPQGITATDLVLTITQILRQRGVVGKFVEFYGPGLASLSLADRATIANMAPEYGATCGFFPVDKETLHYLQLTGRDALDIELVERYCKAQDMWYDDSKPEPIFSDCLELDLHTIEPSLAGPKRPQDRVSLSNIPQAFNDFLEQLKKQRPSITSQDTSKRQHGDVVIAAITSCTNTSNPSVLMAAGLLAKKAVEQGLTQKPWVKTSLAPGSKVVTDYLKQTGLQTYLNALGFNLVGYGCTTCIGNSGPLEETVAKAINDNDLVVSAVLSGNRNFEGRVHPQVRANWLASPPLVVAYALAGTVTLDLTCEPIGINTENKPIYLKDLWPSNQEIQQEVDKVSSAMFKREYQEVFQGDSHWQALKVDSTSNYHWHTNSTYIQKPPFFENLSDKLKPIQSINKAYILALLGDSVTTDHISPAGSIKANSPAGIYLTSQGVTESDFNSYGARRGNHQVMMRGTFANIRLKNEMVNQEGGYTIYIPEDKPMSIYDAAIKYQQTQQNLIIIAGKEYGTGSSRDWAAKGTLLLGVKAVVAESFERIHRSNLIGMGVLPLQFTDAVDRKTLKLTGKEQITIQLDGDLAPGSKVNATIHYSDGKQINVALLCRIDTNNELKYYQHGGILPYVLRQLI